MCQARHWVQTDPKHFREGRWDPTGESQKISRWYFVSLPYCLDASWFERLPLIQRRLKKEALSPKSVHHIWSETDGPRDISPSCGPRAPTGRVSTARIHIRTLVCLRTSHYFGMKLNTSHWPGANISKQAK